MSVLSGALTNAEPVDSVIFIHDYVQITFQEVRLSIYGRFTIFRPGNEAVSTGDQGFCDAVVGLIEDRIVEVEESADRLDLLFQSRHRVSVELADPDGPELLSLTRPNGPTVVG